MKIKIHIYNPGVIVAIALLAATLCAGQDMASAALARLPDNPAETAICTSGTISDYTELSSCDIQTGEVVPNLWSGSNSTEALNATSESVVEEGIQRASRQYHED